MRTLALLALLATGARAQQQSGPPQTLSLSKQNGGIATFFSGNRIGQPQSPYILNGYLDADAAVVKRNGYQVYGTIAGCSSPVTGGWPYTSLTGTYYFFVQCGGQIYETNGNGTFSVIGGTVTTVNPTHAVASLGYEWFADGIDNLWYTDGVAITSVTTAPYAKFIGTYQNRVLLSNITGGPAGAGFTAAQSGSWLSGYQNGSDYSLPAVIVDTSAAFFPLNGSNDTRQVTCIFDGFKSVAILWNQSQMWGLYGTGNSSFILQLISNEIGCTDQGSVQEYNGHLHWLSKRGIEDFDGTSINMISWPIQDQVQGLIVSAANRQENLQTSQADWQAGNLTASGVGAPMNATYYPGDVTVSSATFTDMSSATWTSGSLVNVSTYSGTLMELTITTNTVIGGGFGAGTTWSCSNSGGGAYDVCSMNTTTGCPSGDSVCAHLVKTGGGIFHEFIVDANSGSTLSNSTLNGSATPRTVAIYNLSSSSAIYVAWADDTLNSPAYDPTLKEIPTTPVGWYLVYDFSESHNYSCGGALCSQLYVANVRVSSYPPTGSYVSSTFDTTFSTPTLSQLTATLSSSSVAGVTFKEAASADKVTWSTVTASLGVQLASKKRYWRYEADFTTSNGTTTAKYNGVAVIAETTGYYITQCIQPVNITSWGALQSDNIPDGGSFTYYMSTGATCASATLPSGSWTQQTLNTTISVATAPAVAVRVLFGLDIATEVPRVQDITVNYYSGSNRPEIASTVYNKRYYLAYTTNTATSAYNDHALVFDTNNTWTLLDDIYASSIFTSNLQLYTGSSKSDGNVFLQDVGTVDNGNAFQFRVDTPDLDLGNFAAVKDLDDWWVEAKGTTQQSAASNVAVNYFVDGGTTPYSAGTFSTYSPERGYLFSNGNFGLSGSPTKARTLRLQYLDTSASPLRIYQTNLRYWTESLP